MSVFARASLFNTANSLQRSDGVRAEPQKDTEVVALVAAARYSFVYVLTDVRLEEMRLLIASSLSPCSHSAMMVCTLPFFKEASEIKR